MTNSPSHTGPDRAEFYARRARNYRRQAESLLERDSDTDSASALMYESAKQCINAVANLQGENPAGTGAKIRALRSISEQEPSKLNLMRNWESALMLHIHADRGILEGRELTETLEWARAFVDAMLNIYERERRR